MKVSRVGVGGAVSALYLLGVPATLYLIGVTQPSSWQDWGNFLAGLFAPVAFLWFVLGYFQQGEELQHSTSALKLQAEELRNSVLQQTELVQATHAQISQTELAQKFERMRLQPLFSLTIGAFGVPAEYIPPTMLGGGEPPIPPFFWTLCIRNSGEIARNLEVHCHFENRTIITSHELVDSTNPIEIRYEGRIPTATAGAAIKYIDALGNENISHWQLVKFGPKVWEFRPSTMN